MSAATVVFGFAVAVLVQSPQGPSEDDQIRQAMEQLESLLGIEELNSEQLQSRVEGLSELKFRQAVPVDFMTRTDLASYIRELFEAEYPAEFAEREQRALRLFGFLADRDDLRDIRSRVLNENIAGFYDERDDVKKLFAISATRKLGLMNQLVLAHELRHALQDQHVDLGEQLEVKSDYDDRRVAVLSLLEGDATLFMEHYLVGAVNVQLPGLSEMIGGGSLDASGARTAAEMFAGPALKGAPSIVREQLIAPYLVGRAFAKAIYDEGGSEGLAKALSAPPRSMEQVLYPDKYLSKQDEPVPVSVISSSDEEPLFEGTLGELYIRVLLSDELGRDRALSAAQGWGGDHFALLQGPGHARLVWETVWDDAAEAEEFHEALAAYSRQKFGTGYAIEQPAPRRVRFERSAQ